MDEEDIEIRGNSIQEVYKPLHLPYLEGFAVWPEYNFHIENACSSCQGLMAYTMTKVKHLDKYDENEGIDIIMGRMKEIPESIAYGNDLILVGDCTHFLKNKIEAEGKACVHVAGCPPGEPLPYWGIIDRKNQPNPELLGNPEVGRKRMEDETDLLMKKMKQQK